MAIAPLPSATTPVLTPRKIPPATAIDGGHDEPVKLAHGYGRGYGHGYGYPPPGGASVCACTDTFGFCVQAPPPASVIVPAPRIAPPVVSPEECVNEGGMLTYYISSAGKTAGRCKWADNPAVTCHQLGGMFSYDSFLNAICIVVH